MHELRRVTYAWPVHEADELRRSASTMLPASHSANLLVLDSVTSPSRTRFTHGAG